ncbi:MAG: amidohydrolase family protein, partial [Rhodospirillales bacterium]|nr:amidohydrolase family protein [Rhodospirillales bacterium]
REVLSPIEILRSATTIGAEILRMEGRLGTLRPGAFADLLVLDGDPLADFSVLQDQGAHIAGIMQGGRWHKNLLS